TDAGGRSVQFSYDASGHINLITGLTGHTVQLVYLGDRLIGVLESPGFPQSFQYDGLGRLTRIDDLNGNLTNIGYHLSLNVVAWVRSSIASRSFSYDQGTRTTTVRDSTGPSANVATSYVFGSNGSCTSVTNSVLGTTTNNY